MIAQMQCRPDMSFVLDMCVFRLELFIADEVRVVLFASLALVRSFLQIGA